MPDHARDKFVAVTIILVFVGGALCGAAANMAYVLHEIEHLKCEKWSIRNASSD